MRGLCHTSESRKAGSLFHIQDTGTITFVPLCRPYVYAVHSEQPDSFGHRLGPLSSEVICVCVCVRVCASRDCYVIVKVRYLSFLFVPVHLGPQLDNPLREIDNVIGQLMNGLKQMNLHRCVNVIVVGDHGKSFPRLMVILFETNVKECDNIKIPYNNTLVRSPPYHIYQNSFNLKNIFKKRIK